MNEQYNLSLKARIIVQVGGENFLGPGRIELLEQIQTTGSIAQASKAMGMSYKKALHVLNQMNTIYSGRKVIQTRKGGLDRGGCTLTPFGEALIQRYRALESKIHAYLEEEKQSFLPEM